MVKKITGLVVFFWVTSSSAASLDVKLIPGQWEIQSQSHIEGKDISPLMHSIKQQAALFLNERQRKKLNEYDPNQFVECLSPEQAQLFSDPKQAITRLSQALGQCQLQLNDQTATSIRFSGTCDATKHGIAGHIQGQVNYDSSTAVHGYVQGKGTLPPPIQLVVLGKVLPEVEIRNTFTAQWQQTSCQAR